LEKEDPFRKMNPLAEAFIQGNPAFEGGFVACF
jgi:hypothetical protein